MHSVLSDRWEAFKRFFLGLEDRWFDWISGIDTIDVVTGDGLATYSQLNGDALVHHASWCRSVRLLLQKAYQMGFEPEVFVDVGCGKGKACFYAARYGTFKRIIGLDFDASLIRVANENRVKFGKAPITFELQDAAQYLLPEEQAFVYMFNPFDDHVLRVFLENNLETFQKSGHIIGYSNDVHRAALEQVGFRQLYRDDFRKLSLWEFGGEENFARICYNPAHDSV